MTEDRAASPEKAGWKFPSTFWFANGAELCERAAYYGMFITLARYLHDMIGFTDVETFWIAALFSSILYFLPTFMGIMADKIGFKQALMVAFALLCCGYVLLGAVQEKSTAIASLILIMFGGAIVKPVISGTAAKCSTDASRARAMSVFYMVVNIGSFSGKTLAGDLNDRFGLQYINLYAAGMAAAAFLLVAIFYRNVDTKGTGKTIQEALHGLAKVMGNVRFLCLILIVAGFWAIQGQLYGLMPTYMERLLGKGTKPEWLANINPLVVVMLVVPITHMIRKFKPENAIGIGLLIIPFTALVIGLSPLLESITGSAVNFGIITLHPITITIVIGIGLQGLAECFLSPKFLEYASKQAPEGEVGLYLGYQHLTTFFAWLFGFALTGYLLNWYCPDPHTIPAQSRQEWRMATDASCAFTLGEEMRSELAADRAVNGRLREAFDRHGVDVPPNASLTANEDGTKWTVPTAAGDYTIEADVFEAKQNGVFGEITEYIVHAPTARSREEMPPLPSEYARAHWSWYAFTLVGFTALTGLLVFKFVTNAIDKSRAVQAAG